MPDLKRLVDGGARSRTGRGWTIALVALTALLVGACDVLPSSASPRLDWDASLIEFAPPQPHVMADPTSGSVALRGVFSVFGPDWEPKDARLDHGSSRLLVHVGMENNGLFVIGNEFAYYDFEARISNLSRGSHDVRLILDYPHRSDTAWVGEVDIP